MRTLFTLFVLPIALFSCDEARVSPLTATAPPGDSLLKHLGSHAKQCDTCISTLIVSHHEGTEYRDIYVDSGTVYVPQQILQAYDSVSKRRSFYVKLNTTDMYFTAGNDFYKLWADTTTFSGFRSRYRITGKATGLTGSSPNFQLLSFTPLDPAYSKTFDN